ncbi:PHP domain-containing protein [Desulfovibrio oxyclinae]|uniref:PHP domain-containing protein n=1 Tax=Desulfovibrio oxyclinae TaxID=63560 RepID=UPI000381A2D0|nr:PHP domain-containing protein [Desulfovibrio oxyclinae]
MLIDLHVHSSISPCSILEMDTILTRARLLGMDAVCITDHDTMRARQLVREGKQENGLQVIIGMEYATDEGDYLIFGPFEKITPGMSAPKLVEHVHDNDGAIIGAHPFRQARPADASIFGPGLCDIVEVANGRNRPEENIRAMHMARRRGLAMTAGSDAHTPDEIATRPTCFTVPVRSRTDLVSALRNKCFHPHGESIDPPLPDLRSAG